MFLYSTIYAKLIYPVYHFAIRSDATKRIHELASHDRMSREQLAEVERAKLLALLDHAKKSVPYYAELLSEIDTDQKSGFDYEDFRKLPVLTKDIIRKQVEQLVSRQVDGNRLDPNSTSGSTGEPLSFYTDLRSKSYRKAAVARNRAWVGIHNGDPVARLWGADIDARKAQSIRGTIHGLVTREIFLSAYELDEARLRSYAEAIRKHKAKLLIGYPSVLSTFGEFCVANSIAFPSLKAIICSAEALMPFHRESIESNFSAPLYNRYGCREVGDIAQEAPGSNGLVVNSDRVYVEILDEQGHPCGTGETGDIVITDLDNYGMPLIRYVIGDRGSWAPAHSTDSEMPYPVLADVEGRSLDVVVTPTGNQIGGTFWTILLRKRPGIKMFRVVQSSIDAITIQYVRVPEVRDIDTAYFEQKIREKCGSQMSIQFEEVTDFNIPNGEKFRLVTSMVDRKPNGSALKS